MSIYIIYIFYGSSLLSCKEMFSHQCVTKKSDSEHYIAQSIACFTSKSVFSSVLVKIMKVSICSSFGVWSLLIFCSVFGIENIHQDEEDDAWIDPHDFFNDPTTKRMKNPATVKHLNHLAVY